MRRTEQPRTNLVPNPAMLTVGGMVLAISITAFFRVPLLPMVGADLDMTAAQLGLVTTAFALGRLATDIPAGHAADRRPPLWTLGIAGLVMAVGSAGFAAAPSGLWVMGAAVLLGIASSMANTTGMTYFSTATAAEQRGMSMAGFSAALLGGQALGPLVGGVLGDVWGWRTALATAAVCGVAIAVMGGRSSRRTEWTAARRRATASQGPHPADGSTTATRPLEPVTVARPGRSQLAVLYAVAFSSFFMLGAMPQTLVPIIGADAHELTAAGIGLALGVGGACRLIGSLAGGRLADRVSRKASLVPGLALCALGVAVLVLDAGVAGWIAAIVLFSLGSYGISVGATMLADHARGAGVGRRLGTYRFVGDIGLICGPLISATLYEHGGQDAAILLVAGLLAAVALLSGLVLHETRWLEQSAP